MAMNYYEDNQYGKGISFAGNIDIGGIGVPADSRLMVENLAKLDWLVENKRVYDGMIVYCKATGTYHKCSVNWNSDMSIASSSWKQIEIQSLEELKSLIASTTTAAMEFKGVITDGNLPTLEEGKNYDGHMYKIATTEVTIPAALNAEGGEDDVVANPGDSIVCEDGKWYLIPSGDDATDTWRAIKVNGTEVLGIGNTTKAVNFVQGNNVTITGADGDITITAADTHYESKLVVANSATDAADETAETGQVHLNLVENNEVKSSHKIVGAGSVSVTHAVAEGEDDVNTITISVPEVYSKDEIKTILGVRSDGELPENLASEVEFNYDKLLELVDTDWTVEGPLPSIRNIAADEIAEQVGTFEDGTHLWGRALNNESAIRDLLGTDVVEDSAGNFAEGVQPSVRKIAKEEIADKVGTAAIGTPGTEGYVAPKGLFKSIDELEERVDLDNIAMYEFVENLLGDDLVDDDTAIVPSRQPSIRSIAANEIAQKIGTPAVGEESTADYVEPTGLFATVAEIGNTANEIGLQLREFWGSDWSDITAGGVTLRDVIADEAVNSIEEYVGTFETSDENVKTVIDYIDAKTTGIASDASVEALNRRMDAIDTTIGIPAGVDEETGEPIEATGIFKVIDETIGIPYGFDELLVTSVEGTGIFKDVANTYGHPALGNEDSEGRFNINKEATGLFGAITKLAGNDLKDDYGDRSIDNIDFSIRDIAADEIANKIGTADEDGVGQTGFLKRVEDLSDTIGYIVDDDFDDDNNPLSMRTVAADESANVIANKVGTAAVGNPENEGYIAPTGLFKQVDDLERIVDINGTSMVEYVEYLLDGDLVEDDDAAITPSKQPSIRSIAADEAGKALSGALHEVEVGTGLTITAKADNKQKIEIDETTIFILDCNW